jgi:hypothetical protein
MPYASKEQQNEYQRLRNARIRAEWFADKICRCGSKENLEIHHTDPSTKIEHRVWSWSKQRREEELAKCEVLCKVCHAKETLLQFLKFEHGTLTMYKVHHCRCVPCTKVASEYRNEQRRISGRKS